MASPTDLAGIILGVYYNLSPSEKLIADYILKHNDCIDTLSAKEIAERAKTSTATVSRFIRTLGFKNYAELKFSLSQSKNGDEAKNSPSLPSKKGSLEDLMDFMHATITQELNDTADILCAKDIAQIVRLILKADITTVVGVGNSLTLAQSTAFKLTQAGLRSVAPSTTDAGNLLALSLTSYDFLIVLSLSGRSRRLSAIMDAARDAGTPIALMTSNDQDELAKRADIVVKVTTRDRLLSTEVRYSQLSLVYVTDLIVFLLLQYSNSPGDHMRLFDQYLDFDHPSNAQAEEGSSEKPASS